LYPDAFNNLILKVREYIEKVTKDDWQKIEAELSGSKKLISIKEREEKNLDVLSKKIAEDQTMKEEIVPKINRLLKELIHIGLRVV
jgi:hypothetical protein